jgi:hypothetical protein
VAVALPLLQCLLVMCLFGLGGLLRQAGPDCGLFVPNGHSHVVSSVVAPAMHGRAWHSGRATLMRSKGN